MKLFFFNNLGIRAVIIYFCSVLIGLINEYKKITQAFACLCKVCVMVFICIDTFNNYC